MGLGVFIHKADSIYDDSPAKHYQFPSQYLGRASGCLGDWIIYYEPTKVPNTRGYYAVAKVSEIVPDPSKQDHFLVLIEPGSYLPFPRPVSLTVEGEYVEHGLLSPDGKLTGRAQSAVRPLSDEDFYRILDIGLGEETSVLPREANEPRAFEFDEPQTPFTHEFERGRISILSTRAVRDRVFREVVLRAYDARCAISGIKLINGGGRAEVEAAHIQPVANDGPDIVNNGLALSGTVHWMFDRGLISLGDDLEVLVSRQANDQGAVRALINSTGHALPTIRPSDRPHPSFLRWHRDYCFKQ
ncbi:HNH endonuclease [Nisaea acidiphila]|uniref:HNH endonuclease n=1 Tax=Nisaea acidiphila TaxID=1862145 RepID=A0A9J7APP6_9PROT|nr:HNH endonuclease [Nisaea acidiphila]UUX49134.1 HNH endonuclease [Nisaea acidiphila]